MHYAQFAVWRLLPFYLAGLLRLAPGAGGLLFMLTPVGTAVAAPLAGWATDRYGSRWPGVAGLGCEAVGLFAISRFDAQTPLALVAGGPALVGLGLGAFQVPNLAHQMMGAFPRGQQGAAGGVAFLSRTLGIVAGVEVAAGLFDARAASLGFAAAFQGAAAVCAGAVHLALIPAAAVGRGPARPGPAVGDRAHDAGLAPPRAPCAIDRTAAACYKARAMSASRWVILGVCTLSFIQVHIHRVGFAPLIPTFISDLGITYTAAGTMMTAYFWTYTAVQVPIGMLTDRLGSRRVMLAFMAVLVLGVAAFVLSRTYGQGLLARSLVGLGAAAVWLPGLRLINEWFPPGERGRATGIFSAGGGIGGTTALLVVPLLADRFGWRVGYGLTLIPVAVTLAAICFLIRSPASARSTGSPERVPAIAGGPGSGPMAALARVLRTRAVWPFSVTVLLSYGAYISLVTWLPAFLVNQEGLSRSMAGLVTGLMTGGTIVSWPLAGFLSDRLGRRKAIFLFSQSMTVPVCLAFALLVPGAGLTVAVLVAVVTGLVLGGMVTPFVMVAELFPAELVGTASGVVNTFCFLGSLIVPVALGKILDVTGSFPAAFIACAAVQALALLSAAFTRETGLARRPALV